MGASELFFSVILCAAKLVSDVLKYCLTSLSRSLFSLFMSLTGKKQQEIPENRNENNVI